MITRSAKGIANLGLITKVSVPFLSNGRDVNPIYFTMTAHAVLLSAQSSYSYAHKRLAFKENKNVG